MRAACPRLVIAGTGSGVGKTSLALGLARWLARQGLRVQTFKVGPDFLDPSYLAMASGRTCYNLDGWMTSRRVRSPALRPGHGRRRHRLDRRRDGHVRRRVAADARREHGRDCPVARRAGAVGRQCPRSGPQPGGHRQGLCRVRAGRARGGGDRQPGRLAASPGVARRIVGPGGYGAAAGHAAPRIAAGLAQPALGAGRGRSGEPGGRKPRSIGRRLRAEPGRVGDDRVGPVGREFRRGTGFVAGRSALPPTESSPGNRPRRGLSLLLCRQPGIAGRRRGRVGAVLAACETRACRPIWTGCTWAAAIPRRMPPGWPTTGQCSPTFGSLRPRAASSMPSVAG